MPYEEKKQQAIEGALQGSATELSRLSRQVGYGLVGFALAMLVSDSSFPKLVAGEYRSQLVIIAALGSVTVLCDYLQYLFGYLGSTSLLRRERKENSLLNHIGLFFFFVKQLFSFVGAVFLVALIGKLLIHHA